MNILYQGSGGAIGDLLLSSHYMFHQYCLGNKISVTIPENLREELKDLYAKHTFLENIIMLKDISENPFLEYALKNGYEPSLYIKDVRFLKNAHFHPISEWMPYTCDPTIPAGCIGIHVCSSSNYARPKIPHLQSFIRDDHVAFFGTEADEALFNTYYPDIRKTVPDELWRFGKDSLLQTFSNIRVCSGVVAFSSWSAYAAVLQGVPAIELWYLDQWQQYAQLVAQMLGRPVHYVQCPHVMEQLVPLKYIFHRLNFYSKALYETSH